jgi:hypothetical protein
LVVKAASSSNSKLKPPSPPNFVSPSLKLPGLAVLPEQPPKPSPAPSPPLLPAWPVHSVVQKRGRHLARLQDLSLPSLYLPLPFLAASRAAHSQQPLYSSARTSLARLKLAGTLPVLVLLRVPLPFRPLSKAPLTLPPSAQPVFSAALLPKPSKPQVRASVAVSQLVLLSVQVLKLPSSWHRPHSNVNRLASLSSRLKVARAVNTSKLPLAALPLAV